MACYDFPNTVVHDPVDRCGRYKPDGICTPLPTPVEPYTPEERHAVEANAMLEATLHGIPVEDGTTLHPIRAYGTTIVDGEVVS